MNKLIIIGNGFDLSLGLKTSYQDFLLWLLQKYIMKAYEYNKEDAPFPQYKDHDTFGHRHFPKRVNGFFSNKIFDILIAYNTCELRTYGDSNYPSIDVINKLWKEKAIEIYPKYNYGLIRNILEAKDFKWVDIEGLYFHLIKTYYHQAHTKPNSITQDKFKVMVNELNTELSFLTDELKEYLINIQSNWVQLKKENHLRNFKSPIFRMGFQNKEVEYEQILPNELLFLNFNYTKTIEIYLSNIHSIPSHINYIHGSIDKEIIFGYGDEMDNIYKEIEELNDNVFFQHIKSFHYFKSPEFRQLLAFLDSNMFQVCIYGHSCGLSDRVLLNEIFEHDNCDSIRVYHRGKEDYFNKTMDISRHFNSNKLLRRKMVNYSEGDRIPQINEE